MEENPSICLRGWCARSENWRIFKPIGLPTLQGYGLTEASLVVSCTYRKIQVETVGPPFKTNLVKIAEDGEILIKGENVMLGYLNKQKETDGIQDGWLYTVDIGELNQDGNLKITDRKKN